MSNNKVTWLPNFFSNPLVGFIGTVITIIGLIVSIVFYFNGLASRELAYHVYPMKANVYKSDQTQNLKVFYANREIKNDVTVAHILIWNKGKLPIKSENLLSNIKVKMSPSVPILEVKPVKISRSVTNFSFDSSQLSSGVIPLDWRILEQNDYAVLQLIYEGSLDTKISVEGDVEGQSIITCIKAEEQSNDLKTSINLSTIIIWIIECIVYFALGYLFFKTNKKRIKIICVLCVIIILCFICLFSTQFTKSSLPFNF